MLVKIGNKVYDSNNEPIMVVLSEEEKELISSMGTLNKFCSFPDDDTYSTEEIEEFMFTEI